MTVLTTIAKAGPYAGAGTTGPFAVPFRFLDATHLRVIRKAQGVETVLALTADYTVTGVGAASGSVTLTAPLPVGQTLTVVRSVPATQEADYVPGDAFPAESHEQALDKLTMITQQQQEQLGRAVIFPTTDESVSELPPAAQRSLRVLGFDTNGDLTTYDPASQVTRAENVSYLPSGTGAVATNVQSKLRKYITPEDYGALGDGVADDTQAINDAIQAASVSCGVVDFQRSSTYRVTGTLFKPVRVVLRGNYCTIVPAAGTYVQNYVLLTNSTDGLNWTRTFPTTTSGQIDGFIFDNTSTLTANLIAIGLGDSSVVTNIVTRYMHGTIYTLASVLFLDQKIVENVFIDYHQGTQPMLLLRNFGDMSTIKNVHPFAPTLTGLTDVIQLNNAKAVTIQNCGAGSNIRVFLKGCRGITLESCTFEDGRFAAESSDFEMNACWFAKKSQGTDGCIKLSRDASNYSGNVFTATLNNVQFARLLKTAAPNLPEYDIVMESEYTLSMADVYRTTMLNDSIRQAVSKTKPLVYSTTASNPHQYNKYAHALEKEYLPAGTVLGEVNAFYSPVKMADNINWLNTLASGGTTWNKPTATYFYKAQFLTDVDRRIGFTDLNAERSRSVTNSMSYDSGVYITAGSPNYRNSGRKHILRLYRGISAGSYDEYVDIPTTNGITHLFDSGTEINGYFWKSRTAGGVDTLYFAQTTYANTEQVTVYGATAAPTVGTWKVGDRVYRIPVAGQPKSWVCTVAGTPGTWTSEGNL